MKRIVYYLLAISSIFIACTSNKQVPKTKYLTKEEIDKHVREINEKYHITIQVTDYDSVTYESVKEMKSKVKKFIKEGIIRPNKRDSISLKEDMKH